METGGRGKGQDGAKPVPNLEPWYYAKNDEKSLRYLSMEGRRALSILHFIMIAQVSVKKIDYQRDKYGKGESTR